MQTKSLNYLLLCQQQFIATLEINNVSISRQSTLFTASSKFLRIKNFETFK